MSVHPFDPWELKYAPYDPATYETVLGQIQARDVVLDVGAGDFRLARQMAAIAKKVYAIEISPRLFSQALKQGPLPKNLIAICADARVCGFPSGLTVGVLLMRHCSHFPLYAQKLRDCGAVRLITNARWGMGVESVSLSAPRIPYNDLPFGWYACLCGSVGFKPGPADGLSEDLLAVTFEVSRCPKCR